MATRPATHPRAYDYSFFLTTQLTSQFRPLHEEQNLRHLAGLCRWPAGPAPLLPQGPWRLAGLAAADPDRAGSVRHRARAAVRPGRPLELAADSVPGFHLCRLLAHGHRLWPDGT